MRLRLLILTCIIFTAKLAWTQNAYQWKSATSGGYGYKYVTNDPTKTRFYTLKNGLTVILSQNNKEPNIVYKMAVRAGSNTDPRTSTGLAHYLEHLLFKGTDQFGTVDYSKEKPLLDKIEALYESYIKSKDASKRKEIYAQIDKLSGEASNYSIANEYDKIMKSIGSESTNAHTSFEETVYEEDLPSNAVEQFLAVQAERFRAPVFRLFHTELEAVYEEKNISMDNDEQKMYEKMLNALFPTHNYGQQTTLGTVEHLKNPSLVEIRKYYNSYYVPNNMALIMSGDIRFDDLIKSIDKYFSYMASKPFDVYAPAQEQSLKQIQKVDIYGPSAESLFIAFRGYAQNTRQSLLLDLISNILSNGKAGLMDININKKQKMLRAGAGYEQMKDYGVFMLSGAPKAGQSLEDAQRLLLDQVELLKQGEFEEGLIKATVANLKLDELKAFERNDVRANYTMTAFIQNGGKEWDKMLAATDVMEKITKKEIVDFANQFFVDNYAAIFKHQGEDKSIVKVEKPSITAVNTNADEVSSFAKQIMVSRVEPIEPKFLDYKKDLNFGKAGIADVIAVRNTENGIFSLSYRFEMGSYNEKLLPYAAQYLSFLSTDRYSAESIGQAFYNIACSYSINVGTEVTTISISGLQANFTKAVSLVEDILISCKPNEKALDDLKARILKSRENGKLNKEFIMDGLVSYAQYGAENPFNYGLSNDEVKAIKSSDLLRLIHNLTRYKHLITYYGPETLMAMSADIVKIHHLGREFKLTAPSKQFTYIETDSNKVYFADYDMVQAEVRWARNAGPYDSAIAAKIALFNNYFGLGMGSIVSQTIRESKALAYSTFAAFSSPKSKEKQNVFVAYVGTQADKMNDAVAGMNDLLTKFPESEKAFELSKAGLMTGLETSRITNEAIITTFLADKKLGFNQDSRIDMYFSLQKLRFSDIKSFYSSYISGKKFSYCIVGSKSKLSFNELSKFGAVQEIPLEKIFGY